MELKLEKENLENRNPKKIEKIKKRNKKTLIFELILKSKPEV